MTALHYTTQAGDAESMFYLLEANANVALYNSEGQCALHLAASAHSCFCMILISALNVLLFEPPANLDVDVRCSRSNRPLHYAAKQYDLEAMRLLVLSGADLGAVDSTGLSGLDRSARLVPLVQQALDNGVDVTSIIHEDKTLWHLLTVMHTRAKIIKRIEELTAESVEDLPRKAMNREYCLQLLAEIDRRLDLEFAGYDYTKYRDNAQQMAQEIEFDYTLLTQYNVKRSWASGWAKLATSFYLKPRLEEKWKKNQGRKL